MAPAGEGQHISISFVIIPVMFSVHTGVSWNLSMAIQPGWHSTMFGPFFVVGALFSGVAAVILVMIVIRKTMRYGYFMREEHFDAMGIFLLLLSLTWIYFYFAEWITNWYGNLPPEVMIQKMLTGPAAPLFYLMLFCNIIVPVGTLWSRRVRRSLPAMFIVCVFVQIGMYLERILIVAGFLSRTELSFNWVNYTPHLPEIFITIGTFSFLALLYILSSLASFRSFPYGKFTMDRRCKARVVLAGPLYLPVPKDTRRK